MSKAKKTNTKNINLALQGGGAHGAYTWGVLDYLLEDGRLNFEAVSATSAGAMNAVALAYGQSCGKSEGARVMLETFWKRVSEAGNVYNPLKTGPFAPMLSAMLGPDLSPAYTAFEAMNRVLSPYQANPFNLNPLRNILEELIDFECLQSCKVSSRLFLSATNVRSGKIKVFKNSDLSVDAVLASACLPYVFQAVEIDGEHYWDGGYMGNPAIYPLIYRPKNNEVLIVHINPLCRPDVPKTAAEIHNRINEISFNSSLMREMRAIAFVSKLIDDGKLEEGHYNNMHIHSIHDDEVMGSLSVASKFSTDWDFLVKLKEQGRNSAKEWLDQNFDKIGKESSIDIHDVYL